jgi:biotin operon repressor
LAGADAQSDCTDFIHFLLHAIETSLSEVIVQGQEMPLSQLSLEGQKDVQKSSEKTLSIIQKDPHISARRIAEPLGLSSLAVEKQMAKLKADGKLMRIGAAKGGHWKIVRLIILINLSERPQTVWQSCLPMSWVTSISAIWRTKQMKYRSYANPCLHVATDLSPTI